MRYFLVIKYDGKNFYGFQRQKDLPSVQKELETKLSLIFNEDIKIKGAGRTDRGVHAKGQCIHFDSINRINPFLLKRKLNKQLNNIFVKKCRNVCEDFHSRFSVKKKHYMYKITFNNKEKDSFYKFFSRKLDVKKMKDASNSFIGVHNFQNFVSGYRENYDCIIYKIKFRRRINNLTIHFYGKSFYRYMVRNMVGALIDVGKGKATKEDIVNLLNHNKTDKMLSTAPAKGLTLVKIYY